MLGAKMLGLNINADANLCNIGNGFPIYCHVCSVLEEILSCLAL
jgi:hypothetical protein